MQEYINRAKSDPEEDYQVASRVEGLVKGIREGHDNIDSRIEAVLNETGDDLPLLEAIQPLKKWEEEREYKHGVQVAVEKLEAAYEDARHRGWVNVAVFCLYELVRLRSDSGQDVEETVDECVSFLEEEFIKREVYGKNFSTLVDIVSFCPAGGTNAHGSASLPKSE